jgi:hypothetical protein
VKHILASSCSETPQGDSYMQTAAGQFVIFHIKHDDGTEESRSGFTTFADEQNNAADIVYYDTNSTLPAFRAGVKHKSHEDVEAGKELYYWTSLGEEGLGEEGVYYSDAPASPARTDDTHISVPEGAAVYQDEAALNRYVRELQAKLASVERVAHADEQALDQALEQLGHITNEETKPLEETHEEIPN